MDLITSLKKAIQGEIEGRELYRAASERSSDPRAKEVFNFLSLEEDDHIKALEKIGESFSAGEKIDEIELKKYIDLEGDTNSIFSKSFKSRLEGKHFEISALSIGIKLELDSFKFYADLSSKADDPVLKNFFQKLSEWEKGHYTALLQELDSLQEEYFNQNHFAAF